MVKRVVFSIKIREPLKKRFKQMVAEKGFSTCFIVETLLEAWLAGLNAEKTAKVDQSNSIVVNQKIEYNVSRARRSGGDLEKFGRLPGSQFWHLGRLFEVDVHGEVAETNRYVNPPGIWVYDPDL